MIAMVHPHWINADGFFTGTGTSFNESVHVVRPRPFAAGSVFVYRPFMRHRGGANRAARTKVVLDVMFVTKGVPSLDDTPMRWGSILPGAWWLSDLFVRLPLPRHAHTHAAAQGGRVGHAAWQDLVEAWHAAGEQPHAATASFATTPASRKQKGEL